MPAEKPKPSVKIKFLNKAGDAINLPAFLRSTLSKFQFTLEIKSHQLYHMNTLALLPVKII